MFTGYTYLLVSKEQFALLQLPQLRIASTFNYILLACAKNGPEHWINQGYYTEIAKCTGRHFLIKHGEDLQFNAIYKLTGSIFPAIKLHGYLNVP